MFDICAYCENSEPTHGCMCDACHDASNTAFKLKHVFEKQFTYLYFANVNDGEFIKIGITNLPLQRMRDIARDHKCKIEPFGWMFGGDITERVVHGMFSEFRTKTNFWRCEWFHPDQSIRDYASAHTKPIELVREEISCAWDMFKIDARRHHGESVYRQLYLPDSLSRELIAKNR